MSHNPFPNAGFDYTSQQPASAVPRKRRRWPWILIAVGVLLFVIGGLTNALSGDPDPAATETAISDAPRLVPVAPVVTTPKAAPVRDPLSSDGTYRVGAQVLAGTYSYTVTSPFGGYWATCTDLDCNPGSGMTGNDYAPTEGQTGFIDIAPTDVFVELSGLALTPA